MRRTGKEGIHERIDPGARVKAEHSRAVRTRDTLGELVRLARAEDFGELRELAKAAAEQKPELQALAKDIDDLDGVSMDHQHDGVLRKNGDPRCCAAYPSGARCPRTARFSGMCWKCIRRGAQRWDKSSKRRAGGSEQ